jgi:hypothetical protein
MNEHEVKQALAGLIDQEPDRGVDVLGALQAGRSALRARRVSVVLSCAVAALVVAIAAPLFLTNLGKRADVAPAVVPAPSPVVDDGRPGSSWCRAPGSSCVDIRGWIVFQRGDGIWAVDPRKPDNPDRQIQLIDQPGVDPLEWSRDGTKLLVRSWGQGGKLVVLHADGSQTLIADGGFFDGSFSPDGSMVAFTPDGSGGMSMVDAGGGVPRSLIDASPAAMYELAFSPDGKQIAYFSGGGDNSHTLRVMDSDGTDARTVWFHDCACHIQDLDWSPDGRRLMLSFQQGEGGIWTLGVDGSDLTQVVPDGVNPSWSPDGTRISYQQASGSDYGVVGPLRIADADGANVTEFGHGGSGAWNPLAPER